MKQYRPMKTSSQQPVSRLIQHARLQAVPDTVCLASVSVAHTGCDTILFQVLLELVSVREGVLPFRRIPALQIPKTYKCSFLSGEKIQTPYFQLYLYPPGTFSYRNSDPSCWFRAPPHQQLQRAQSLSRGCKKRSDT